MNGRYGISPYQPQFGCLLLFLVFFLLLVPLVLFDAAQLALHKLHLSPAMAVLVLLGIILGGLINLPLTVVERQSPGNWVDHRLYSLMDWVPVVRRQPQRTVVAINVGGGLIPIVLALVQVSFVVRSTPTAVVALLVAVALNVAVCYGVARPVPGIGIGMPAFTSPLVCVLATWILLPGNEFAMARAPVAFAAGVAGPVFGADLLHFREVLKMGAPVVSIGGAGTFDGIVLSGLLAAFLA